MGSDKINKKPVFITVWKSTHEMLKELSHDRMDDMIKILYRLVKREYDEHLVQKLSAGAITNTTTNPL